MSALSALVLVVLGIVDLSSLRDLVSRLVPIFVFVIAISIVVNVSSQVGLFEEVVSKLEKLAAAPGCATSGLVDFADYLGRGGDGIFVAGYHGGHDYGAGCATGSAQQNPRYWRRFRGGVDSKYRVLAAPGIQSDQLAGIGLRCV